MPKLSEMARAIGMYLRGSTVNLDGVYDCRANRKSIFNLNMRPDIPENRSGRKTAKRGRKRHFDAPIFEERFRTIERVFAWEEKFRRPLLRFERLSHLHYALKTLAYDDQSAALLPHLTTSSMTGGSSSAPCAASPLVRIRPEYLQS